MTIYKHPCSAGKFKQLEKDVKRPAYLPLKGNVWTNVWQYSVTIRFNIIKFSEERKTFQNHMGEDFSSPQYRSEQAGVRFSS